MVYTTPLSFHSVRADFTVEHWKLIHDALVDINTQRENALIEKNAGDTEFRSVDELGVIIKEIQNLLEAEEL